MSKAKKKSGRPAPKIGLNLQLARAEQLFDGRKWDEVVEVLAPLTARYPDSYDIWAMLADSYQHMGATSRLWEPTQNLLRLRPNDSGNWFNAINLSLANGMPYSAVDYAKEFLRRFPDDKLADEVKTRQAELEKITAAILASEHREPGVTEEDLRELEQSQIALNSGNYRLAERLTRQISQRSPALAAPLNNLTLVYSVQGRFTEAIEVARQVLQTHPDNVHALSNLAQCLWRAGQREEAETVAERLIQLSVGSDDLVKQIEGLSYLGKDATIVDLFERSEAARMPKKDADLYPAMLHHLVAVAYARQGDTNRAKQLWQQALKREPGFQLAQENLDELKLPVGQRGGAFPFSFAQWMPLNWVQEVLNATEKHVKNEPVLQKSLSKLLQDNHPLEVTVSILLERGDSSGREFALLVAGTLGLPVLLDFAQGTNGTDDQRMRAAQKATEHGMLPKGKAVSLVNRGKRQDVFLLDYEITDEPDAKNIPKDVQKAINRIHEIMMHGKGEKAEELTREALATAPDEPTLWNYLVASLQLQKKTDEADAIIREMGQRFPDYLFTRTAMAQLCVREKKLDEAHTWLDPITQRKKLHISEYRAFCGAQIDLLMAEKQIDGAKSWLKMWESVDDARNPALLHYVQLVRFSQPLFPRWQVR